jgi:hypothetical protein
MLPDTCRYNAQRNIDGALQAVPLFFELNVGTAETLEIQKAA